MASPVVSARWQMRRWEWPPSRWRCSEPSGSRVNSAPSAASSSTRAGPSSQTIRTASGSFRCAPATSVSRTWFSTESSGSSTALTPPCAYRVLPSNAGPFVAVDFFRSPSVPGPSQPARPQVLTFVTTVTRPCSATASA